MSKVTVKYRSGLAETVGKTEEIIPADSVADVLKYIKANYGRDAYRTARAMVIAVNEVGILKLRVFKTALEDGDVVQFLPIAGGG
ncbi:MAG: MoaD/ThiS family protein [Clostridiales Family XIII bacterium]|nr:MoaD/ThiS family protein [Clostridiales Family XIII bacterium]